MKILLVADVPLENPCSGSEQMVSHQASGLSRSGMEVCAIVRLSKSDEDHIKKVGETRVAQFYAPPDHPLRFMTQHLRYPSTLYERFRRNSPFSAVISHQPLNCFALLMNRNFMGLPLIYNFHSPSHEEYMLARGNKRTLWNFIPTVMRRKIERYCLTNAGIIMVESQYMRQKVIDIHKIPGDRIVVNPGGVDLDRFHPPADRESLKQELGLPAGRIHILTVRNLERRMGVDNLIRAIARLREHNTDIHLVVGGEGPERQNLEQLVRRLALDDNVTMTGFIPSEQLHKYYAAADFFVIPTRQLEGFGLVSPESLACGTPVLGTPVGGTVEILSGFDRRFLLGDVTPNAIAEGIEWAIKTWSIKKHDYALLRERCRRYAEKRYSWNRHIDQLKTIILNLTGGVVEKTGKCMEN